MCGQSTWCVVRAHGVWSEHMMCGQSTWCVVRAHGVWSEHMVCVLKFHACEDDKLRFFNAPKMPSATYYDVKYAPNFKLIQDNMKCVWIFISKC